MYKGCSNKLQVKTFDFRKKILIIDDDPLIRQSTINLVKSTLKNFNSEYEIIEGSDGHHMIDLVSYETEGLISLILTDENMIDIPGSDAIREISFIKNRSNMKVISITALEDEAAIKNIYDSGADMVLNKPVNRELMEKVFRNFGF